MSKPIRVTITQEDMKDAVFLNNNNCPLARAVNRVLGKEDAYVNVHFVKVGRREYALSTPFRSEDFNKMRKYGGHFNTTLVPYE